MLNEDEINLNVEENKQLSEQEKMENMLKEMEFLVSETYPHKSIKPPVKLKWTILRWIGVLPIAFIGFVFSLLSSKYSLLFIIRMVNLDGGVIENYIIPIISNGVSAYAFITVGVLVAPAKKKIVGLILFVLFLLLSGVTLYGLFSEKDILKIVELVANLIGLTIGYFEVSDINYEK